MGAAKSAAAPSRNILNDHFPNVIPLTEQHDPCAADGHPDLWGLSYSRMSLPRKAWAIGDFDHAAVATTSSCTPAQPALA